MLGLKLIHVSERGHKCVRLTITVGVFVFDANAISFRDTLVVENFYRLFRSNWVLRDRVYANYNLRNKGALGNNNEVYGTVTSMISRWKIAIIMFQYQS